MKGKKFDRRKAIIYSLFLLLAFFISVMIIPFYFYFHEIGHIIFGLVSYVLFYRILPNNISWNYMEIPGFKVPQQTIFDPQYNNFLYAIGGPVFGILLSLIIVFVLNKIIGKSKLRILFLSIIISFSLTTILGDVIFGTDNWTVPPVSLLSYSDYSFFSLYMEYSPVIMFFTLLLSFISVPLYKLIQSPKNRPTKSHQK